MSKEPGQPLKILYLSSIGIWGMGEGKGHPSVYRVVRGFIEAGHEVHYAWPRNSWIPWEGKAEIDHEMSIFRDRTRTYAYYQGMHLYRFNADNRIRRGFKGLAARWPRLSLAWSYSYFCSIAWGALRLATTLAPRLKPDVVYGSGEECAVAAWIVAKKFNIPNITRIHGSKLYPLLGKRLELLKQAKRVIGHVLPCSYFIMTDDGAKGDRVLDYLGVPRERVRFWRNGVDDNFDPETDCRSLRQTLQVSPEQPLILSACRLERWKGVHRLVLAAPAVVAHHPEAVFVILGNGSERPRLQQMVGELGLEANFRFVGQVTQGEVSRYMNCADIFCSLADLSSGANPTLEAMMHGRCIIVLDRGKVRELIRDGENGCVVPPAELGRLGQIINELLEHPQQRFGLGRAARLAAQEYFYSWEQRARMEVQLIENLVWGTKANNLGSNG